MKLIIRLLWIFVALVTLAGVGGVAAVWVPALGWAETWSRWSSALVARPWIWVALLGWGSARFFARPGRAPLYTVGLGKEAHALGQPETTGEVDAPPLLAAQRDRELRRLQLAAFLKGRTPDVPAFVDALLSTAAEAGAGDVHLQPRGEVVQVTFRVKGNRQVIAEYGAICHRDVVRRIKVLSGMTPYVSERAQDGSFQARTPFGPLSLRVSVVPSSQGETVALRLAGDAVRLGLGELGLEPDALARLEALLREPQGLIVLTGPTGSGKTTTLYSALAKLHETRGTTCHMVSIEDPVEVDLPFVHQMQVDRKRSLGFAEALRSLLRQDPDILMVGEIRDPETAKVAVQAGLSGHLILTTLHADSVVGVFPRLIELGVEPFLVGSASLACVSQRLMPRLCPACRHPRVLTATQRRALETTGVPADGVDFFTAEGCRECEHSGVGGRLALFDVLVLDAEIRRLVATKAPVHELQEAARAKGAQGLFAAALAAARRGDIALDEALRLQEAV